MKKIKIKYLLLFCCVATFNAANAQDPSWFKDVTIETNLDSAKGFAIYVADLNGDDYPDLVTLSGKNYTSNRRALRVYLNEQNPDSSSSSARWFKDITDLSGVNAHGLGADTGRTVSVAALGDVDNDGDIDMITGTYYHRIESTTDYGDRCEVLLNDGNGYFTIKPNNGLKDVGWLNTLAMSLLDYDLDGILDVYFATYFSDYTNNVYQQDYLFKGTGNGAFYDVSAATGIDKHVWPHYGVSAGDWNNDCWPDIMTGPYCRNGGILWENLKTDSFQNVASTAGYNAQVKGGDNGQAACLWGAHPADFDNDGDLDFYFSLVHGGNDAGEGRSGIVENLGAAQNYQLQWDDSRIGWEAPMSSHRGDYDAAWLDINNDGLEDLITTQGTYVPATDRSYILLQDTAHNFTDITQELDLLSLKNTHAVEPIDFDLDGDDDILVERLSTNGVVLLENKIGNVNNHVSVKLLAPPAVNGSAIGSKIQVYNNDGTIVTKEVYAGRGNGGGQQAFIRNFGLGSGTADSIVVKWADLNCTTESNTNVTANALNVVGQPPASSEKRNEFNADQISLYPNPAADKAVLLFPSSMKGVKLISVFNIQGQLLMDESCVSCMTYNLELSSLNDGVYFIQISGQSAGPVVKKLVLQRP